MRAGASLRDDPRTTLGSTQPTGRSGRPLVWSFAALAVVLAVVATWKGPGLTTDSVGYLSTGVNIAEGNGLVMLADQPLTIFPPGVPMIAAAGHASGLGAEAAMRFASIASFGMVVLLGERLLRMVSGDRRVVLGATALLAVSPALLEVSKMAWSEPPFIVLTIVFLIVLGRVAERRVLSWRDVAVLTVLCWAAFMLRYVGVALIAVAGLVLVASVRPLSMRVIARIAGFGVLGASVPFAWMLRNHAADGTFLGHRSPSHDSLRDVLVRTAATLGEWLLPAPEQSTRVLALIGSGGAALAVIGLIAALRAPVNRSRSRTGPKDPSDVGGRALVMCCAAFCVVYIGYLTVASLSTSFEPTNSRYLSPAFVPAAAVVAAGITAALERGPARRRQWPILSVLAVLVAGQAVVSVQDARDAAADGIGFGSRGWSESALSRAAETIVGSADRPVVYSNSPSGLWAASGIQPIHWAPRDTGFRGVPTPGELGAFAAKVGCSPAESYLVIHLAGDTRVVSLERIRETVRVERVAVASDGAVFRLSAPRPAACPSDLPARARRP